MNALNAASFAAWLQGELTRRGWPRTEAARRGGVSASMFDKVITGAAQPGLDFLLGVARALGLPRETIFRQAGILPPAADTEAALLAEWRELAPAQQRAVLDVLRAVNFLRAEAETLCESH